uniref:(California timema) hypothetical protein n=1 Tax=Timema californicum TaxID=61474 RepID=A0A7R9IYB3_TIMCA|nr:unnamed protein product [Timema californicum]
MTVFSSVCIGGLHTTENKKGNGVIYINHTDINPKLTELWKNVSSVSASSKRTIGNQPTVLINQNKTPDSSKLARLTSARESERLRGQTDERAHFPTFNSLAGLRMTSENMDSY